MDYLEVKNKDLPFDVKIKIKDVEFTLSFKYSEYLDRIYCDLIDSKGNDIAVSEKLVFGVPLFYYLYKDSKGNINRDMPQAYIRPWSVDGKEIEVNIDNFGESIKMIVEEF